MCLVAFALDHHRRFPLVVAANRDEFFARPAARLAWWSHAPGDPQILGGRDLEAGGTWLGLSAHGRLALVTNVRNPKREDPHAPSRGRIVPEWLGARDTPDRFWMRTALSGYNGFNLIAADFAEGVCYWASNLGEHPRRLERGVYGMSNAALDTPWPKVAMLKTRLGAAIDTADSAETLASLLFAALADRAIAADSQLPDTGIGVERERLLSAAFIRTPDLSYGTRCSTLVIAERSGRQTITHVFERTFSAVGGVALMRRASLRHWPPRYGIDEAAAAGAEQTLISESEVQPDSSATPVRRTRVRSLLKPDPGVQRRRPLPKSA